MIDVLHNRTSTFIDNLDRLTGTDHYDAFITEVRESPGQLTPPANHRSHLWELGLHQISASGTTEEEAIANWIRIARKSAPPEEIDADGFITVIPTRDQLSGDAA